MEYFNIRKLDTLTPTQLLDLYGAVIAEHERQVFNQEEDLLVGAAQAYIRLEARKGMHDLRGRLLLLLHENQTVLRSHST